MTSVSIRNLRQRRWTPEDDKQLAVFRDKGFGCSRIGRELGRSRKAVQLRLKRIERRKETPTKPWTPDGTTRKVIGWEHQRQPDAYDPYLD